MRQLALLGADLCYGENRAGGVWGAAGGGCCWLVKGTGSYQRRSCLSQSLNHKKDLEGEPSRKKKGQAKAPSRREPGEDGGEGARKRSGVGLGEAWRSGSEACFISREISVIVELGARKCGDLVYVFSRPSDCIWRWRYQQAGEATRRPIWTLWWTGDLGLHGSSRDGRSGGMAQRKG